MLSQHTVKRSNESSVKKEKKIRSGNFKVLNSNVISDMLTLPHIINLNGARSFNEMITDISMYVES